MEGELAEMTVFNSEQKRKIGIINGKNIVSNNINESSDEISEKFVSYMVSMEEVVDSKSIFAEIQEMFQNDKGWMMKKV